MKLDFHPPSAALAPYVDTFYLFRSDALGAAGVERVDIGQLRFLLKGEGAIFFADGHFERSRAVTLTGPGTASTHYRVAGPFYCFGVSLRPIGWRAITGLNAREVADRIIDGAEVLGAEALALLERLRGLTSLAEMAAAAEPFLLARAKPLPASHIALACVVREWVAIPQASIDTLYAMAETRAKMGPRQVTRLLNAYYGGSAQHLARKYRAVRAAMAIRRGADPTDAAGPFYDQPHMIRELRQFIGLTPTQIQDSVDPVLAVLLEMDSFEHPPAIFPEIFAMTTAHEEEEPEEALDPAGE